MYELKLSKDQMNDEVILSGNQNTHITRTASENNELVEKSITIKYGSESWNRWKHHFLQTEKTF